jgi:hypothetical protein
VPTLAKSLFRLWLWAFRIFALLLVAMGVVGASAGAILIVLRLSKPDFMPSLPVPFVSLYMVVAAVFAYIGIRAFKVTLGGDVNRIFANLVERRGWRSNR